MCVCGGGVVVVVVSVVVVVFSPGLHFFLIQFVEYTQRGTTSTAATAMTSTTLYSGSAL